MAGLTPVLGTLGTAISGLSAISSVAGSLTGYTAEEEQKRAEAQALAQKRAQQQAQQSLALAQLQEKQQTDIASLEEDLELERQKIIEDTQVVEDQRLSALRRAVARQNVQFASQGISSADSGSTEAVLLGLFEESDEQRTERERIDDLRNKALSQELSAKSRLNILQQSQLQEQQRLERALLG